MSAASSSCVIEDLGEISWKERLRKKPKLRGKYLIGDFLGEGTFAKVFEALDTETLQRRGVKRFDLRKILRRPMGTEIYQMIEVEIRLLKSVNHENVIKVVDTLKPKNLKIDITSDSLFTGVKLPEKGGSKIWMFLEYCVSSVEEVIMSQEEHRLPKWQAHKYFTDLISGLEYLHSHGIIHMDIKPQNLLISCEDRIKITDFGVSQKITRFSSNDICVKTFGTYAYQPPELFKFKSAETMKNVSTQGGTLESLTLTGEHSTKSSFSSMYCGFSGSKCDIWAAGVVLYRMITGQLPFIADYILDLIDKLREILSKFDKHFHSVQCLKITNTEMSEHSKIKEDPFLEDLLNGIFDKDYKLRYTMNEIRHSLWFKHDHQIDEPRAEFPPRYKHGDQYRSMTITPFLHELHYPLKPDENEVEVSEVNMEEIRSAKRIPIIRGNRTPSCNRARSGNNNALQMKRILGTTGIEMPSFLKPKKRRIRRHHSRCIHHSDVED